MRPLGRLIGSLFFLYIGEEKKVGGRRVFVFFSLSCFLSLFLPPAKSPESLSKACPKIPKVPQSLPEGSPKAPHLAVLAPQSLPKAPQSLPRVPQTTPRLPRGSPEAPQTPPEPKMMKKWYFGTPKVL